MRLRTLYAVPALLCLWGFVLGPSPVAPTAAMAANATPDLLADDDYDNGDDQDGVGVADRSSHGTVRSLSSMTSSTSGC